MGKLRVLVAEDSLTVRKYLVAVLEADPGVEVIGEAVDGEQAVAMCQALRPDVVTLDMVMPRMSGVAATEQIMAFCPTPILVVSSASNRGELIRTYEALAAGAVDVLDKPDGRHADVQWERLFLQQVKLVAKIKVITHPRAKLQPSRRSGPLSPPTCLPAVGGFDLVAIGASTGGPGAIVEVLRQLPANFPLPLLFVIHIGDHFGQAFADWLDALSPLPVRLAEDGLPLPRPGEPGVVMAPPGRHLEVRDGRLRLSQGPERHSCRPSVDVLFESVARELGPRAIGCLLTGMGRDGAEGLLAMRQAGGQTIAQDEATSVVYGMPREAARLGAAGTVLPLGRIGAALVTLAGGLEEGSRP